MFFSQMSMLTSGNPTLSAVFIPILLLVIFVVRKALQSTPGPNPFPKNVARPPKPPVSDPKERDKVIKQGFVLKKIPPNLDFIVVGSGIGGLSVAAILAKAGKRGLVLEQHDQAGGCCHSYIEDGFEFDVGIHYIGEMEPGRLQRTLIDQLTEGQLQWEPLDDPFDYVIIGDLDKNPRHIPIYKDRKRYRAALIEEFPNEVEAIDKYMEHLKTAKKTSGHMVNLKFLPIWLCRFLISTGVVNMFYSGYFKQTSKSVNDVVKSLTDDKDLQAVFAYNFGDYGTPPGKAPFILQASLANHFMNGGYYPIGGASEIAFHLIPIIEKTGGRVLVRANVQEILVDLQGKAHGVRVKKAGDVVDIHSPMVISAAGLYNTYEKLLPERFRHSKPTIKRCLDLVSHGTGALSVFAGIKGTKDELNLKARNIWAFSENDLQGTVDRFTALSPSEAMESGDIPLMFLSFPSTKDPTWEQRYPGKTTCAIITLAPYHWFETWADERVQHRGPAYKELKTALGEQLWKQACKLYPQIADKREYFEVGTPLSNNYYIGSSRGEIYGIDHDIQRFGLEATALLRPQTDIHNLYLTGQDILCCGFSGALWGGVLCASAILNRSVMKDVLKLNKRQKKDN